MRLLLVALFLEVGLVLIVAPWSSWWDRNYFAQLVPDVHAFITNNFVRGAVSGLGVVNVAAAITELFAMLVTPRDETTPPSILPGMASRNPGIEPAREQE